MYKVKYWIQEEVEISMWQDAYVYFMGVCLERGMRPDLEDL